MFHLKSRKYEKENRNNLNILKEGLKYKFYINVVRYFHKNPDD